MAASGPVPSDDAGQQTLRLDADRTRDELVDTLGEIRRRLAPKQLIKSATETLRTHPRQVTAASMGVAAIITGIVLLARRANRRG